MSSVELLNNEIRILKHQIAEDQKKLILLQNSPYAPKGKTTKQIEQKIIQQEVKLSSIIRKRNQLIRTTYLQR